jgi:hypothetical protein
MLTTQDRLAVSIALDSLDFLKRAAAACQCPIAELTAERMTAWLESENTIEPVEPGGSTASARAKVRKARA